MNQPTISMEGISLQVKDLETSMAFYAKLPGISMEFHRPGSFVRYRLGDGFIHLLQMNTAHKFHMELNTPDVQEAYDALKQAGLSPSTPKQHPWGKKDFKLMDPDGNCLEIGLYTGETP